MLQKLSIRTLPCIYNSGICFDKMNSSYTRVKSKINGVMTYLTGRWRLLFVDILVFFVHFISSTI